MAPPLARQLHEQSLCPYRPLQCLLGCLRYVRAVDLEYHHTTQCEFRVVRVGGLTCTRVRQCRACAAAAL
jgi:hypothetical protein